LLSLVHGVQTVLFTVLVATVTALVLAHQWTIVQLVVVRGQQMLIVLQSLVLLQLAASLTIRVAILQKILVLLLVATTKATVLLVQQPIVLL
jgi:hypothetical protein